MDVKSISHSFFQVFLMDSEEMYRVLSRTHLNTPVTTTSGGIPHKTRETQTTPRLQFLQKKPLPPVQRECQITHRQFLICHVFCMYQDQDEASPVFLLTMCFLFTIASKACMQLKITFFNS